MPIKPKTMRTPWKMESSNSLHRACSVNVLFVLLQHVENWPVKPESAQPLFTPCACSLLFLSPSSIAWSIKHFSYSSLSSPLPPFSLFTKLLCHRMLRSRSIWICSWSSSCKRKGRYLLPWDQWWILGFILPLKSSWSISWLGCTSKSRQYEWYVRLSSEFIRTKEGNGGP